MINLDSSIEIKEAGNRRYLICLYSATGDTRRIIAVTAAELMTLWVDLAATLMIEPGTPMKDTMNNEIPDLEIVPVGDKYQIQVGGRSNLRTRLLTREDLDELWSQIRDFRAAKGV